jgi:hypothetical protein
MRSALLLLLAACSGGTIDDDSVGDDDSVAGEGDVVINEFMASNSSTIADETGAFPDWVELWNAGDTTVDLGGHYLTDDLSAPTKWEFPAGTALAAGDWLLVWCDGDVSDGALHAGFKLSAGGEDLGLFGPSTEGTPSLDELTYDAQAEDVSSARMPDGSMNWAVDTTPTPGAANQ